MAASTSASSTDQRCFSWSLGLLLAVATVLNIAALSKAAWVEEETYIPSELPVAVFRAKPTGAYNYSEEDLNPSRQDDFAVYKGMRAGSFHICFTLADMSSPTPLIKEQCSTYREMVDHQYVYRKPGARNGAVTSLFLIMCEHNSHSDFAKVGIPSAYLPAFLNRFCGRQYLMSILQIGAIVASFSAWITWLWGGRATPAKRESLRVTLLTACTGATLTLATYVLWVGAFTTLGDVSQGSSAHCTIAAAVLLAIASLVAHGGTRRQSTAGSSPTRPLV